MGCGAPEIDSWGCCWDGQIDDTYWCGFEPAVLFPWYSNERMWYICTLEVDVVVVRDFLYLCADAQNLS